jgi:aminoglycoside phosphotransferase (APT) family kinase protein
MGEVGPLVAAGRDSEIFEYGPGRVLRRPRDGRSLAHEADVMRHVEAAGYPVPHVEEVLEDGSIVMERLDGRTMLEVLPSKPHQLGRHAALLADLHERLHRIDAPPDLLPQSPDGGSVVVHLDLHPANVMLTSRGPVVIDWANTVRGDGATDVALTWLLMATADAPAGRFERVLIAAFRKLFVRAFLRHVDRDAAATVLPAVVEWKCTDDHMSDDEKARMRALATHVTKERTAS